MQRYLKLIGCISLMIILSTGAVFAGDKVYFYHTDAAGTPVAMTDASGNVVWQADYKPFGEEHTVSGSVENKNRFIGKEKDEETDLNYFGARYLDARTGRFIKPDPVGIRESDLLNPQKFNRYNYSLNNPYRYVDPDGREAILQVTRFYEARQAVLGWAPSWLQEIMMPVDPIIGPAAIESGGGKFIGKGLGEVFDIAKAGGKNAGLLKTYSGKGIAEIEKGIQSLESRVSEHLTKISDPSKFAEDWAGRSPQAKEGLIKYWEKEAAKYKEQADVLRGLRREKVGD